MEEDTIITFGGEVKALGAGKLGGHLVLFGSPEQPDVSSYADFFTPETDFDIKDGAETAVYYQHGLDPDLKLRKLGRGKLRLDDEVGVWIEAQLSMRDAYEKAIYALAEAGKLGWSSGTATHLVERKPVEGFDGVHEITHWPLGLDASLTPTPAEPRTRVMPVKALTIESITSLLDADGNPIVIGTPDQSGSDDEPSSARLDSNIRPFQKSIGGVTMDLIALIKQLVPGLSDEQYEQLEAVLRLAGMVGDGADEPLEEAPAETAVDAEASKNTTLDARVLADALKQLGIAPQAPARPPYTFQPADPPPDGGEGIGDGDGDGESAVKSVAMLRFGETPAAIKGVVNELYGDGYAVKRLQQHQAYGRYLRYGEGVLTSEERSALKTIYLTPNQIKGMVIGGASVAAIKTDLAETVDSLGGFTVPEDMRLDLIERLPGMTVVRSRADVSPTSSDVMSKIKVTGGDDQHVGAMRVTWVGDTPASNQAVTNPTFGVEKTPVHIAMCTVRVPRALLEDTAVPLAQKIGEWASLEFAIDEDEQFLVGNGIAKPQGIIAGEANPLSLTEVVSGDASTWPDANVVEKLMDLKYGVARQYRNNAVWIMNDTTAATISKVMDGVGRPIWYNSLREGEPDRLLGYPALTSEAMPDIAANAYPLVFGDLRGYQIADRVGMTLTRDELTEAEQDIVKFVFRRRLGGQVAQSWRFSVLKVAES